MAATQASTPCNATGHVGQATAGRLGDPTYVHSTAVQRK